MPAYVLYLLDRLCTYDRYHARVDSEQGGNIACDL